MNSIKDAMTEAAESGSREQPASFGLPGHPIAPFDLTNINFYVIGRALGVDRPHLALHVLHHAGQE